MSSLIPQAFINDVLERTDIVAIVDEHVPLKKQGTSYAACCPFHHEKSPSFNVIPKKQFYYCFGCGVSGNAIGFLMAHLHLGFIEALSLLAARLGLSLPKSAHTEIHQSPKINVSLYQLLEQVKQFYQKMLQTQGEVAQIYLQGRGLSADIIARFQLGYAPNGWQILETVFKKKQTDLLATGMLVQTDAGKIYDRYRQRLMFPIHDRQGRVVGFGGRVLEADQKPKYLNSPETALFHKSRELYGLYQASQILTATQAIIVVEGYLDVIALAQYGIDGAVATLGTAVTTHHLQLLRKYTKRVVFCFDGDEAGRKAAWRALENGLAMVNELELTFMFLPAEHDPDSFIRAEGQQAFLQYMSQAVAFNDFFFEHLKTHLSLETLTGKSQLIQHALPYLADMPEGAYQTLLIDQLARLSRIDSVQIRSFMNGQPLPNVKNHPHVNVVNSPLRVAIALLLQYPERFLQRESKVILEADDEEPGIALLRELLVYLKQASSITTAILVEQWRHHPWFDALQKLVCWDHQIAETQVEQEFDSMIVFLNRQCLEKQIQQLLSRSRLQGLEIEEKNKLQALLKKRHQLV